MSRTSSASDDLPTARPWRSFGAVRARRYTTDISDAEWETIEPVMRWSTWLPGNGGRLEKYCRRLIVDGTPQSGGVGKSASRPRPQLRRSAWSSR
jgi:hypothetical protein